MRHPEHHEGILSLPTLLRVSCALGSGMGVVSALLALLVYRRQLDLGSGLGLLVGSVLFNALALSFATLVGYWPYRALARRRRFGLHRLSVFPLPAR